MKDIFKLDITVREPNLFALSFPAPAALDTGEKKPLPRVTSFGPRLRIYESAYGGDLYFLEVHVSDADGLVETMISSKFDRYEDSQPFVKLDII